MSDHTQLDRDRSTQQPSLSQIGFTAKMSAKVAHEHPESRGQKLHRQYANCRLAMCNVEAIASVLSHDKPSRRMTHHREARYDTHLAPLYISAAASYCGYAVRRICLAMRVDLMSSPSSDSSHRCRK